MMEDRNIRIARQLVRIARMLVAGKWNVGRIEGLKKQWNWHLDVESGSIYDPACVSELVFECPGPADLDADDDSEVIYKWFNKSELKDSCRIDLFFDEPLKSSKELGVKIRIDAKRLVPEPPINIVRLMLLESRNLRNFV